jgi:Egh16-like virulence factor
MQLLSIALFALAASSAHAHIKMLNVVGSNGGRQYVVKLILVTGTAFAIQPSAVSDNGGLATKKFEGDTTIFSRASTSGCGRTENSGQIDCAQEAQNQLEASGGQLPTCASTGEIAVTMHQVNEDGAGPLKAFVDTTGTGTNFQQAEVNNL